MMRKLIASAILTLSCTAAYAAAGGATVEEQRAAPLAPNCITVERFAVGIMPGAVHIASYATGSAEAKQIAGHRVAGKTEGDWTVELFEVPPERRQNGHGRSAAMFKAGCLDLTMQPWWLL